MVDQSAIQLAAQLTQIRQELAAVKAGAIGRERELLSKDSRIAELERKLKEQTNTAILASKTSAGELSSVKAECFSLRTRVAELESIQLVLVEKQAILETELEKSKSDREEVVLQLERTKVALTSANRAVFHSGIQIRDLQARAEFLSGQISDVERQRDEARQKLIVDSVTTAKLIKEYGRFIYNLQTEIKVLKENTKPSQANGIEEELSLSTRKLAAANSKIASLEVKLAGLNKANRFAALQINREKTNAAAWANKFDKFFGEEEPGIRKCVGYVTEDGQHHSNKEEAKNHTQTKNLNKAAEIVRRGRKLSREMKNQLIQSL